MVHAAAQQEWVREAVNGGETRFFLLHAQGNKMKRGHGAGRHRNKMGRARRKLGPQ
jgi:hypothetical protein